MSHPPSTLVVGSRLTLIFSRTRLPRFHAQLDAFRKALPEMHWQSTVGWECNIEDLQSAEEQRHVLPKLLLQHTGPHLVTTQSPVVLMSMSSLFNPETDVFYVLEEGTEIPEPRPWYRYGDIADWFDAYWDFTYDVQTEEALQAANALMLLPEAEVTKEQFMAVHAKLQATLSDTNRYWMRWCAYGERHGWEV